MAIQQPTFVTEDLRPTIQGQTADSANEIFVANALDRLGHRYIYQYQILDIGGVRGAFRVDFLVLTTSPWSTPVEVFGEYWHAGQLDSEQQLRIAAIENALRGEANDVVIIWGRESETQELANESVREKIGPA